MFRPNRHGNDMSDYGFMGKVLIAGPAIDDPRFKGSVVYICDHAPDFALGFILNRPFSDMIVGEFLPALGVDIKDALHDQPVMTGGPVEMERGFIMHTDDYFEDDNSIQVGEGLALTATRDALAALSTPQAPKQFTFFLGYAGWGQDQLEEEIKDNAWLIADPTDDLLFGKDHENKWGHALKSIGVSPARLGSCAGSA